MKRRVLGFLLVTALLLAVSTIAAACDDDSAERTATPESEASVARFEESACDFTLPEGQQPENVRCGFLVVPEDRAAPDGRSVRLAVAVLKASGSPAPDPVLYLSGGRGYPALEGNMQRFTADFARPLQAKRDLVFFDQRGAGRSQPALYCPEVTEAFIASLAEALTTDEEATRWRSAALACRNRLVEEGINLAAYTSAANAADIDDLMRALGYDEWNLYGFSYGTRLALTTMRDKPEGLRSVVLDSTIPLQANFGADRATNFQRSLDLLFAACAADAGCNAAFPDLQRVMSDLVAKLNSSPVTLEVKDPSSERTTKFVVTGDRLLRGLGDVLYQTNLIPLLPVGIYTIANDNYGVIAMLAAEVFMFEDVALGMAVVDCSESTPFLTPDIVAEANKDVRSEIARAVWGISTQEDVERELAFCRAWGVKEPEAEEHEPVTSDIPTLVLAGEYDPFTPPSYGRLAAETLSHSHMVEFPATGQGVLFGRAPCAMTLIAAFLDDPQTRPDDSCASQLGPPEFVVP